LKRTLLNPLVLWLVPVLSLSLTAYAWYAVTMSTSARVEERFRFRTDVLDSSIHERMKNYEDIIRGVGGLFHSSDSVTRDEWQQYMDSIRPDVFGGGLQAIGISLRTPAASKASLELCVQAEHLPFCVWPAGARDEYHPIVYIHPFEGANLQALGYDISAEATRRRAIIRATDSGEPTLSGRIRLAQEDVLSAPQPGFVLYYPIYGRGLPTGTVAQRRAALRAVVFAAFRARDLMESVFAGHHWDVQFEIFDGEQAREEALLYRSTDARMAAAAIEPASLLHREVVTIAGQPWLLHVAPSPEFLSSADRSQPWLVAAGGVVVSLMFVIGLWSSATVRQRAVVLAERMSGAFRVNEAQTRMMVDSIADHAIFRLDASRNVASWNAGAERMLGYAESEILGRPVSGFSTDPADGEDDTARTEVSLTGRYAKEAWYTRKHGDRFWGAMAMAPLQREAGGVPGYVVILRDDTDRRQAMEALADASSALEQRTVELGRFNRLAFGRELRMIELKRLVNERSVQLGMPAPFDLSFADGFEDVRASEGES